ncbi:glycoside hydrolase family protein [Hymenobacter mucosus]|uniref:hypothetical protein n=1 Tax=Hymenobacter mucosus TaxID=1411120 RepID=UPI001C529818|nr:hypothetical protein [Hymenobacter mucosus]
MADNGTGTFTNPLFYNEFSDPDMIRVGNDDYLTGTSMHARPTRAALPRPSKLGVSKLRCNRLDYGPGFGLEEGKDIYGQGEGHGPHG